MTLDAQTREKTVDPSTYKRGGLMYSYDRHPKTQDFLEYYFSLSPIERFLRETRERKTPQTVLDLGSGEGEESNRLKKLLPKAYIVSMDLSSEGARSGKDKFDLNQVQANASLVPFSDGEFDAVHCKDVLVHIKNTGEFLGNVSRILKPGGLFMLVSSEVAWEGFMQFEWDPLELEIIANEQGLVLESLDRVDMEKEDWYSDENPRIFMLFKKK